MNKKTSILRRLTGALLALAMVCALPLVNISCSSNNEEPTPVAKPIKELPADAGAISQTPLEDGTVELTVAPIERAESYRWYKDGSAMQSVTARTIYATESGRYKVAGVNSEGEGKASAEVEVVIKSPEEPNPQPETFSATVEATKLSFNDIQISVEVKGSEGYYAGNMLTEGFVAEELLANLEFMSLESEMSYTGALVDFPEPTGEIIIPGMSYLVWIVDAKPQGDYTAEDILTFEFVAPDYAAGGSISITPGEPYITQTAVEVDLTAEGAYAISYSWLSAEQYGAADQAAKTELLLSATQYEGSFVTAYSDTVISLEPESDVWLVAMAIDQEGRYGEILEQKYTTLPEPKQFTLEIDEENSTFDETQGTIRWNILDGEAVKTVYYVALADDNFWLTTLGESFDRAIEYIMVNPTNSHFESTTQNYVELSDLVEGRRYLFVAVAFDADDNPSLGDGFYFTPQSSVVFVSRLMEDGTENPDWSATCPTINIADFCFLKGQFTRLFWMVDLVDGTTGYTAAISAAYVDETFSSPKAWARDLLANPDGSYNVYYWEPDDPNIPDPNAENGGGTSVSAKTNKVNEDKIYYHPRCFGDVKIYVTWTDAEGRLYEPVSVDMPVLEGE